MYRYKVKQAVDPFLQVYYVMKDIRYCQNTCERQPDAQKEEILFVYL